MKMLFICQVLTASLEFTLGIWILYQVYGKNEYQERIQKSICLAVCILLNIAHIYNMRDSYISNIYILVESALEGLLFGWIFRVHFFQVFTIELLYWINLSFLKLPILIMEGMKYHTNLSDVNRGICTPQECAWSAALVILAGIIFAFNKKKKKNKEALLLVLKQHTKFIIIIAVLQWCTLSYNMWLGLRVFQPMDLFFNLFFIVIAQLYAQYLILRMVQREILMENRQLDMAQKILQKQNLELQELYNKNRENIHEIYHKNLYVYHCLKENKVREAEASLRVFIKECEDAQRKVWTGLPFFDFLINYKKEEMDRKHINFQLELDVYEYPFEDVELGILLGNLLDNAIEASEKCAEGERYIRMKVRNFHRIFILCLSNSSVKKPECKEGKFITDKQERSAHGMGVKQVERIINKYGGDIEFRYDSEHFEVNIIVSK